MPHTSSGRRSTHRAAASIAVTALLLGGCGDADDGGVEAVSETSTVAAATVTTSSPATTTPATTVPPTTAGAFPVLVEHALGSTEVPARPVRVVALDTSLVDAALALGLELVGYTTFRDPDGDLPAYFGSALDDHASEAIWVGDLLAPNVEAILALSPDLILTSAVRHEAIYDQLSAVAPTIATESAGAGWKDNLRLAGQASGRAELAEELIADYEARAAEVGAAINEAAGDPTISVVRFVDVIRLYQPVSFSGVVLEDAGLARPESQQDRDDFIRIISEEELELADADVIFYTVFDDPDVVEAVEAAQGGPLWSSLGAVQRGEVYAVSDETWMTATGIVGADLILDDLGEVFGVG